MTKLKHWLEAKEHCKMLHIFHMGVVKHSRTWIRELLVWLLPLYLTENGLHFYLRFFCQMKENGPFLKERPRAMKNRLYTTKWSEKFPVKLKWAIFNNSKIWSASEENNTVSLVGLEGDCVLRAPSAKSGVGFRQIISIIGPIKDNSRWKTSGSKECRLPLEQYQTSHLIADSPEISRARIECPLTSVALNWPGTFRLPLILFPTKFS